MDETNDKINNSLSELRAKIQARKLESETTKFVPNERILHELPEITIPVGEFGEFSFERFIQIQNRLDVCYGNFLYWKNKNDTENFESALKELVRTVDLYVGESCRVRYY